MFKLHESYMAMLICSFIFKSVICSYKMWHVWMCVWCFDGIFIFSYPMISTFQLPTGSNFLKVRRWFSLLQRHKVTFSIFHHNVQFEPDVRYRSILRLSYDLVMTYYRRDYSLYWHEGVLITYKQVYYLKKTACMRYLFVSFLVRWHKCNSPPFSALIFFLQFYQLQLNKTKEYFRRLKGSCVIIKNNQSYFYCDIYIISRAR